MDLGWEACVQTPLHSWTWCLLHGWRCGSDADVTGWTFSASGCLGGGDSAYSMTLQNQLIETSQLPHLWLWTFKGGCFMLLVELPDLWLKDTLFVGSPTCLCSFLTPKKCSLPLASRAVTLNAHFRVCFRTFQAKSGSAIPACFHQGCEPMSRSSQLAYFLVICLIIRQYVWYCVFSKLTNWAL